jgi:uncharacterized membrane protein
MIRFAITLAALAGVVISTLALRIHYSTETQPCSINEKWDCGIVNHSPYSEFAGFPVAAIGIAGYLAMAVLALLGRRIMVAVLAVIGLAFAVYLSQDVLMVWCLYCVISQGIILLLAALSLWWVYIVPSKRLRA